MFITTTFHDCCVFSEGAWVGAFRRLVISGTSSIVVHMGGQQAHARDLAGALVAIAAYTAVSASKGQMNSGGHGVNDKHFTSPITSRCCSCGASGIARTSTYVNNFERSLLIIKTRGVAPERGESLNEAYAFSVYQVPTERAQYSTLHAIPCTS